MLLSRFPLSVLSVTVTCVDTCIIERHNSSFKKYDKKAEKANFARVEYKKIIDAIRFYLRGEPFDEKTFLDKLKMVDDFISDHCMEIPAKVEKKYRKRFTAV